MAMKGWLLVLVLLLDDAAVFVLVLLGLQFLGIEIPLPVKIVIAVILGTFVFIIHKAVIPALRRRKITGSEGMIGLEGEVIEALTPVGAVMVGGERWKAKSVDENISAGDEGEVLGVNGLTLMVRLKTR